MNLLEQVRNQQAGKQGHRDDQCDTHVGTSIPQVGDPRLRAEGRGRSPFANSRALQVQGMDPSLVGMLFAPAISARRGATMIPNAISKYLEQHNARYSVLSHTTAYTAQEEAAAAHVPGREWAKTVVCFADGQPILAVLPAPFAVDLHRLRRTAHARSIRLAREHEFATLYQDCEPGAMPPLGPLYGQPVFVDKRLTTDPEVSFSAGSHHDAIRMPYR